MASFDIENLYTNIPLVETIDIILDKLFSSPCSVVFFLFNGKFYKQTDGLGMGQPLSPTFANIFLCFHEEKWLSSCPHFKPVFFIAAILTIPFLYLNTVRMSRSF